MTDEELRALRATVADTTSSLDAAVDRARRAGRPLDPALVDELYDHLADVGELLDEL